MSYSGGKRESVSLFAKRVGLWYCCIPACDENHGVGAGEQMGLTFVTMDGPGAKLFKYDKQRCSVTPPTRQLLIGLTQNYSRSIIGVKFTVYIRMVGILGRRYNSTTIVARCLLTIVVLPSLGSELSYSYNGCPLILHRRCVSACRNICSGSGSSIATCK